MNWNMLSRLLLLLPLVFCDDMHGAEKQKLIKHKEALASLIARYLPTGSAKMISGKENLPIAEIVLNYLGLDDNFGWVDKCVIKGTFELCGSYNFTQNFFSKKSGLFVTRTTAMGKKNITLFDDLICTPEDVKHLDEAFKTKKEFNCAATHQTLRLHYVPNQAGSELMVLQRYALTSSGCTIL